MIDSFYPACGRCKRGVLLPVNLGMGNDQSVRYRCTNTDCNARFDEFGYEIYDDKTQDWVRVNSETSGDKNDGGQK